MHLAYSALCIIRIYLIPENPEISLNFEKSYLLNHNSDENNLYMKNDQKNETNPNMPSSYLSHASSMKNMEVSPPFHLFDKRPEPGKIFPDILPLRL